MTFQQVVNLNNNQRLHIAHVVRYLHIKEEATRYKILWSLLNILLDLASLNLLHDTLQILQSENVSHFSQICQQPQNFQ